MMDVDVDPVTVPAEIVDVLDERSETVLYSNDAVVVAKFALAVPFSVADVELTLVAAVVVTEGALDAIKFKIDPSTNAEHDTVGYVPVRAFVHARILK